MLLMKPLLLLDHQIPQIFAMANGNSIVFESFIEIRIKFNTMWKSNQTILTFILRFFFSQPKQIQVCQLQISLQKMKHKMDSAKTRYEKRIRYMKREIVNLRKRIANQQKDDEKLNVSSFVLLFSHFRVCAMYDSEKPKETMLLY